MYLVVGDVNEFMLLDKSSEKACSFNDYPCGKVFELGGGIVIRTGQLNHPNGACGYRIEFASKVIAICTDTEHFEGEIDQNVVENSYNLFHYAGVKSR